MRDRFKPLFTWRSAVCESDLAPTTRHVALTLSLYMSERGDSARPGAPTLARDTGLSVRAVREHLAELERRGWLRLVERGGLKGERKKANEYRAVVPDPVLPVTGEAASPVQDGAPMGDPDDTDGSSSCTPIHQDLSKKSPGARKRATPPPESFDVDADLRAWAAQRAPDVLDLERHTERFLDHHRARGSTMRDWRAAWRTWMGKEQQYLERDGRTPRRSPAPAPALDPPAGAQPPELERCGDCGQLAGIDCHGHEEAGHEP